MQLSIYLAGTIKKQHEDPNETYWDENSLATIRESLDKNIEIYFLDPATRSDDLSLQKSVFGRDMLQVFSSDLVLVDARNRRGLGVGAEMMWAKINTIPVITWSPKDSHYNRTNTSLLGVDVKNWVHPFIENLSDVIINDLQELSLHAHKIVSNNFKTKNINFIKEAMQFYKKQQLLKDQPMLDVLESSSNFVKNRVETLAR